MRRLLCRHRCLSVTGVTCGKPSEETVRICSSFGCAHCRIGRSSLTWDKNCMTCVGQCTVPELKHPELKHPELKHPCVGGARSTLVVGRKGLRREYTVGFIQYGNLTWKELKKPVLTRTGLESTNYR